MKNIFLFLGQLGILIAVPTLMAVAIISIAFAIASNFMPHM